MNADTITPEAVTALVWVVVADVALASAMAAAYSARVIRKWMKSDE